MIAPVVAAKLRGLWGEFPFPDGGMEMDAGLPGSHCSWGIPQLLFPADVPV